MPRVMRRVPVLVLLFVLGAGAAAVPKSTAAQCRLCSSPTTSPDPGAAGAAVQLEVETSLDFDRLVLLGTGEGTATLAPDGSRSVSGTIEAISGRAMVGSAVVRGEAGRAVRILLPASIEMRSLGGNTIRIEDLRSDLGAAPRLDSSGMLQFRFGGRLRISCDAEGEYRGDIPITVEYL